MKTLQENFRDRSNWKSGEWDNEPDKLQYVDEATGLPCLIVRNHMGSLCGYVGVNKNRPWFLKKYNERVPCENRGEIEIGQKSPIALLSEIFHEDDKTIAINMLIDVHGGLTYSDKCMEDGHVCHLVEDGEDDNIWWFGFDCGHAWDLPPEKIEDSYPVPRLPGDRSKYRNIQYVKEQIVSLAKQLQGVTA